MKRIFLYSIICLYLFSSLLFAHGWKAPKDAAKIINPIPFTKMSQNLGEEIYIDNCSSCHGDNALGLEKKDTGLLMSTPNLIKRLINHTEGDFFWKIQNGKGQMPLFKDDLSENQIWNVINYIKGLSKN